MGFFDNLKNISREAKRQAIAKSNKLKNELDKEYGDDDSYNELKNMTRSALEKGKSFARNVGTGTDELKNEAGSTEVGQAIGELSRYLSSKFSNLPVFSLTTDTAKEKNGVTLLSKHLSKNPEDPERYIWLAEAIMRTKSDMLHYTRIRSSVDPSYYMVKSTVQSLNSFGQLEKDATTIKLLKKAFILSFKRIEKKPRDHQALYCLGRVYYCQGDIPEAIKYLKLSILARKNALSLVTLGKCYLELEQLENARKAGIKAINQNFTYAYSIIAECLMHDDSHDNSVDKIKAYAKIQDKIKPVHRRAYLGPHGNTISILQGVGKKQWKRILNLIE